MKRIVTKLLLGLLATGLLLTTWGGMAWAEEPNSHGLLRGTVTAIEDATLVVTTPQGERSVLTGEETTFRVPGVETATLADVAVGDYVIVHTGFAIERLDEERALEILEAWAEVGRALEG